MKTNVAWARPYQHVPVTVSDDDILARVRQFAPEHVTGKVVLSYTYVTGLLGRNAVWVWVFLATSRPQTTGKSTMTLNKIAEYSGLSLKQAKCGLAILREVGLVKSNGHIHKKDSRHTFYTIRKVYGCPGVKVLAGTGKCVIPGSVGKVLEDRKEVKRGGRRPGAGRPTNEERRRRAIESEVIANDNGTKQESNGTVQTTESSDNPLENYRNIVELYENIGETSENSVLAEQSNGTVQSIKWDHQICSDQILTDLSARSDNFLSILPNGRKEESTALRFAARVLYFLPAAPGSDPNKSTKSILPDRRARRAHARVAKGMTTIGAREIGARGKTSQGDARELISDEDRKHAWAEKYSYIPANYYCYDLDDGMVRSFIRTVLRGGSMYFLDAYVSGALTAK